MANNPDQVPDAAAFGQWRASLAQAGWKQAEINAVWGPDVNGRTWEQISNDGKPVMRNFPKEGTFAAFFEVQELEGRLGAPAVLRVINDVPAGTLIRIDVLLRDNGDYEEFDYRLAPISDLSKQDTARGLADLIDLSPLYNARSQGVLVRIEPQVLQHTITVSGAVFPA